jgi:hypothetical protein
MPFSFHSYVQIYLIYATLDPKAKTSDCTQEYTASGSSHVHQDWV